MRVGLVMARLEGAQACAVCETDQPAPCGLVLLDMDGLKPICRACGEREAPTLQALLDLAGAMRHLVATEERATRNWKHGA